MASGAKAQIKVNSNGNIGFGVEPHSLFKLNIGSTSSFGGGANFNSGANFVGSVNVEGNTSLNQLEFQHPGCGDGFITGNNGSNETSLEPDMDHTCNVGTEAYPFYEMYAYKLNGIVITGSDKKLKENIRDIESALDKINKLKGQKYDLKEQWKDSIKNEKKLAKIEKERKNKLGFIAQDVEKILPEAVHYKKESDTYYLEYDAFIPVIVEAMKEQQLIIDDLTARVSDLESKNQLKSATLSSETSADKLISACTLSQNIPNPFSDNTRIDITLPAEISNAVLYVYNMQGKQIKSFNIQERGNTSVTINGYTLDAGMYLYTLLADGNEVDTKKMILTK